MNIFESVILAIDAVRSHKLRSSLTLLSIAIGIFAIIGSGTAVTSLNETVTKQMAEMGEGVFVLQKFPPVMSNDMWKKLRGRKGTRVTIKVKRVGEPELLEFEIK